MRRSMSMKQGVLAEKMGLRNQSEISRWENSDIEPLDHNKRRIEQVLKVNITPVKNGWVISDSQESVSDSQFQKAVSDINEQLTLDDLPRLIRERDELQRKIDKLVRKHD